MINPSHQLCHRDHSQLIIIDTQTKLGSAMPTKVLKRVIQNTALMIQSANLLNIPILVTEQYPQGLGPTLEEINSLLPDSRTLFEKTSFSCFGAEHFAQRLEQNQRKQVIVTGMEAHICVLQTAHDLLARQYDVFVVEDAICSRKLENYQNALMRLQHQGADMISTESVIFEWLGDAKHPQFKAISALLR